MEHESIELTDLKLDPLNPRLPEGTGSDPEELLQHILEHGSLEELGESFLDNGFFEAERIIVIRDDTEPGKYTVVEGNRRLAALKILNGEAGGAVTITTEPPTPEQLNALKEIPCLLVDSRNDVNQYLAYRHIGGMKTWSAEARARFTKHMVDAAVSEGIEEPFKAIARQVGSNAQGIRNSYLALAILEHARSEFGLNTDFLQHVRFGVWIRSMNSGDIKSYIGIGSPRSYGEVQTSIASLDTARLAEVVGDLSKRPDGRRPLVGDSRDITDYGSMLQNAIAHGALRNHEDFEIARQIVRGLSIPSRIESMANSVTSIIGEISKLDDPSLVADAVPTIESLFAAVRSLRAVVRDLRAGDD